MRGALFSRSGEAREGGAVRPEGALGSRRLGEADGIEARGRAAQNSRQI